MKLILMILISFLVVNPASADTIVLQDYFNDTTRFFAGSTGEVIGTQYVTLTSADDTIGNTYADSNAIMFSNDGAADFTNPVLHDSFPSGSFPSTDSGDGYEDTISWEFWIYSITAAASKPRVLAPYWHDTYILINGPDSAYTNGPAGGDWAFRFGRGYHMFLQSIGGASTNMYLERSTATSITLLSGSSQTAFATDTYGDMFRIVLSMSDSGAHRAELYDETGTRIRVDAAVDRRYIPGTYNSDTPPGPSAGVFMAVAHDGGVRIDVHTDSWVVVMRGAADDVVVAASSIPPKKTNAAIYGGGGTNLGGSVWMRRRE